MADTLPPFTVRTWPVNSQTAPSDFPFQNLEGALAEAQRLAWLEQNWQVQVTDPSNAIWASFNMLWLSKERQPSG
jgi:hypothetical protein